MNVINVSVSMTFDFLSSLLYVDSQSLLLLVVIEGTWKLKELFLRGDKHKRERIDSGENQKREVTFHLSLKSTSIL